MKKPILLLLLLMVLNLSVFALQIPKKIWTSIPGKTSKLYIKADTKEIFNTTVDKLLNSNFEIERYDEQLGTITTAYKPLPRTGEYKLNIHITSGRIIVSGTFKSGISLQIGSIRDEDSPERIEKRGSRNSIYGIAFSEMYNFAEQLGEVTW